MSRSRPPQQLVRLKMRTIPTSVFAGSVTVSVGLASMSVCEKSPKFPLIAFEAGNPMSVVIVAVAPVRFWKTSVAAAVAANVRTDATTAQLRILVMRDFIILGVDGPESHPSSFPPQVNLTQPPAYLLEARHSAGAIARSRP